MSAVAQLRTLLLQSWFDPIADHDHAAALYDASICAYRRARILGEVHAEVGAIELRLLEIDCERVRAKWRVRRGDNPMPMHAYGERDKLRKRLRYLRSFTVARYSP